MNKRFVNKTLLFINKHMYWLIAICIVVIAFDAIIVYGFHSTPADIMTTNSTDTDQQQLEQLRKKQQSLVKAVSKQITLPKDEQPVVATVSDKSKLQDQDFFKQAENGDKVLMYKLAKKAYLYRPSTDRVLAQAPLDYGDTPAATQATAATIAPAQN